MALFVVADAALVEDVVVLISTEVFAVAAAAAVWFFLSILSIISVLSFCPLFAEPIPVFSEGFSTLSPRPDPKFKVQGEIGPN